MATNFKIEPDTDINEIEESADHALHALELRERSPEWTANMLLREAVENARSQGTSIRAALVETVGLPEWMVTLAKDLDYHHLETLRRYLREGGLKDPRGLTLGEVEMLLKVKRYISEELMAPPSEDEQRSLNYHAAIETVVARKAQWPQKTLNNNFTPEKGSWEAPEYDGNDPDNIIQGNLWVFPTRICLYQGQDKPTPTILRISDLERLYKLKMRGGDASEIPIRQLRYEAKHWLRTFKPTVGPEIFGLPDKKRRDSIEFYKREEVRRLRWAVQLLASENRGDHKEFWRLAYKYLGKLARTKIDDCSTEKRIEHQIRRKFNAKKYRIEGRAYLPMVAAGDMLLPMLDKKIAMVREKNPHLSNGFPAIIECFFDSALREDELGKQEAPPISWLQAMRHELRDKTIKTTRKTRK